MYKPHMNDKKCIFQSFFVVDIVLLGDVEEILQNGECIIKVVHEMLR